MKNQEAIFYHHIHELDCVQFFNGRYSRNSYDDRWKCLTKEKNFGDEDDMIFVTWNSGKRFACLNGALPIVGENTMS